jgi:hypothetical protein
MLLQGTSVLPSNVYAADINVSDAAQQYGYNVVNIPENGPLPFTDWFFDIVFCSSVIEHVTVKKDEVYKIKSEAEFKALASARQQEFSAEIERVGKQYFVQTPYKWFLVESHTWLPFIGWLPRELLIPLLSLTNSVWVKKTTPDWHLLTGGAMQRLFPAACIVYENFWGLRKSIMAIKTLPRKHPIIIGG